MRKNGSGQAVGAQLIAKADGTPVTSGTTTVYVTGDAGTQATGSVGSGAATHEGNGFWTYAPAQAETNYDHVAFTFANTNAVNATVQIYTSFPQTGDSYARIGSNGASLTALATQTSVDDLPTNAELATALGTADDAVLAQVALVKAKTDNLPSDPADASVIAAAFAVTDGLITTVDTVVDAIKLKTDLIPSDPAETSDIVSAAAIADAVWDEAIAGHLTAGSTGQALSAAGAAGDPWSTSLPGAYTAGQAGYVVGTNVNATISSRATQTSVDDLPTNAELATALGTADDAVLAAIPTTAQIADKVLGRNIAGGIDGGRMVKDALRSLRNKTSISAGTLTVCEEDDSTPAWTAAVTTTPGDPLSAIDPT